MTKEILTMMDERKEVKANEEEYRHLCKTIKSECNKAKENWLEEQFQDIESLHIRGNTKSMHMKITELSGKKKMIKNGYIKSKDGKIIRDVACLRFQG